MATQMTTTSADAKGQAGRQSPPEAEAVFDRDRFVDLPWHRTARTCLELSARPLLLVGPPGCGKSTFAAATAFERTGQAPVTVYGNAQTEERHLWARQSFDATGDFWIDGPIPQALKRNRLLLLEEVNQIPPEVLGQLLQLRHDRIQGDVIQNVATGEIVPVPDDFRVIMTANPGTLGCYSTGRATTVRALVDGCNVIEVPPLPETHIASLLKREFAAELDTEPDAEALLEKVVEEWESYREMSEQDAHNVSRISARAASELMRLALGGMPWDDAVTLTLVNKLIDDADLHGAAKLKQQLDE